MSEHRRPRRDESSNSSNSSRHSYLRPVVPNHLQRVPNDRRPKRAEESIYVLNPANLVPFHSFALWPPMQPNYSVVYGNISQAVLQPHLRQTCFHRPSQRRAHSAATTVNGLRFWEKLSALSKKKGFVFSLMSYNVLAQDLLDQHPYLYSNHRKEFLRWNIRWNNLMAEIKHFHPDILCLQEVQKSHLDTYFSSLELLGYRGLYKQRTGIRTDGCAIYYKPELVDLVEYTTVEFNQPNVPMLDRDNVGIIAKFSPRSHTGKEFVVATTHLLYNPKRQDVRLAQTQLLLTEVDRIAFNQRNNYLPVIVTGDLNSTPDSAVYKFITEGKLRYESLTPRSLLNGIEGPKTGKKFLPKSLGITDQCQHANLLPGRQNNDSISRSEELELIELQHSERQCEETKKKQNNNDQKLFSSGTLTHQFSLQSVYEHHVNGDVEGTTYQDQWISVDYIFFSGKRTNRDDLLLLERYRLPTRGELRNLRIPNTNLGSDHLSLLAKFQLKV